VIRKLSAFGSDQKVALLCGVSRAVRFLRDALSRECVSELSGHEESSAPTKARRRPSGAYTPGRRASTVSPPELRPEFRRRDRPQSAASVTLDSAPWRGSVRWPGICGVRSLDGRRFFFFFSSRRRSLEGCQWRLTWNFHQIWNYCESGYYYEIRIITYYEIRVLKDRFFAQVLSKNLVRYRFENNFRWIFEIILKS